MTTNRDLVLSKIDRVTEFCGPKTENSISRMRLNLVGEHGHVELSVEDAETLAIDLLQWADEVNEREGMDAPVALSEISPLLYNFVPQSAKPMSKERLREALKGTLGGSEEKTREFLDQAAPSLRDMIADDYEALAEKPAPCVGDSCPIPKVRKR